MSRLIAYPINKDSQKNRYLDLKFLNDPDISWRQKGILTYLLTRPPDWVLRMKDIRRKSPIGRNSLYDDFNSLRRRKYVHRLLEHSDGRISKWAYFVFPAPTRIKKKDLEKLLPNTRDKSEQVPGVQHVEFQHPYNIIDIYIPENESSGGKSDGSSSKANERNIQFMKKAEKLANIVKSQKNVKINKTKLNSWTKEMRLLNEQEGISKHRMTAALNWYKINAGGQYIPVIESGSTFRQKFLKLESAMSRSGVQIDQGNTKKQKPKVRVGH